MRRLPLFGKGTVFGVAGQVCSSSITIALTSDNNTLTILSNVEAFHPPSFSGVSMGERTDLLQGSLDLLILKVLLMGPLHGWGVSKQIRQLSGDLLEIGQGSLYPALYRLEDQGLISSSWGVSPEGRRAKFYTLTPEGEKRFAAERSSWRLFSTAVERVLEAT